MKCPYCGFIDSKVIDSRPAEEGASIRRRRECLQCQKRFTTYEIIDRVPLVVIKRDGSRQSFDRMKVINGMLRACEKRPVSLSQLEDIADSIEQELQGSLEREIGTDKIGEMVMSRMKTVDEVAYVRFASVYRSFKDINTFMDELSKLLIEKT
ncbi:MAG: transcriptional regulator NrdR [Oscillospiraceae bacterium]|nr:transcriptional regulator NrdR [Oscillospiraceae bacterium]